MLKDIQAQHLQLKEYLFEWCKHQEELLDSGILAKEHKGLLNKVEESWLLLYDLQALLKGNSPQEELVANAMLKLKEVLGKDRASPLKAAPVPGFQDVSPVFAEGANADEAFAPFTEKSEKSEGAVLGQSKEARDLVKSTHQAQDTLTSVFGNATPEFRSKKKDRRASWLLTRIVRSTIFDVISMLVIICNATTLGISANYDMAHLNLPENQVLQNLEITFVLFYIIEALLRVCSSPTYYACGPNRRWNAFDVFLIAISLGELIPKLIMGSKGSGINISFLRTARVLKMVRLLRIVRVMKSFKPLRLILTSILGSISAVTWSGALVLMTLYVSSICLVEGCIDLLERKPDISPAIRATIDEYWSSVSRAMHALFLASFGGTDWKDLSEPLVEAGLFYYTFFLFYLLFYFIVIVNTVTSIFLDSILQSSSDDDDARIQDELEKKTEYIQMLTEFFAEIDDNEDGFIQLEEFCKHMEDPRLLMFASSLDIEIADARQFFDIMSNHGSVPLDIDSFVVGCIKLKGNAKSIDLFTVFQMLKTVHNNIKILRAIVDERQLSNSSYSAFEVGQLAAICTGRNEQLEIPLEKLEANRMQAGRGAAIQKPPRELESI